MTKSFAQKLKDDLDSKKVTLVAVSKTKPPEKIQELYDQGIRDFGENKPQELLEKFNVLPKDIRWHMIGNLQRNKVKYIAPFVHLIHSVSSEKLLNTIDKEAKKNNRMINILLQMKIATEETKSGLDSDQLKALIIKIRKGEYPNVRFSGLMGMASFTDDEQQVRHEFGKLKTFIDENLTLDTSSASNVDPLVLSMGMSGDYKIAIESGSNMVRIGSLLFGTRN